MLPLFYSQCPSCLYFTFSVQAAFILHSVSRLSLLSAVWRDMLHTSTTSVPLRRCCTHRLCLSFLCRAGDRCVRSCVRVCLCARARVCVCVCVCVHIANTGAQALICETGCRRTAIVHCFNTLSAARLVLSHISPPPPPSPTLGRLVTECSIQSCRSYSGLTTTANADHAPCGFPLHPIGTYPLTELEQSQRCLSKSRDSSRPPGQSAVPETSHLALPAPVYALSHFVSVSVPW